MRKDWQTKILDELCDFKNGLWKGKKEPFIHVGVIRNTNFTKNGRLDDSDIAYLDVEVKQYASRKLEYGDLILEKSGGGPKQAVGRVIPFEKRNGDFSFSNFTSIIRVRDKNELDYAYLHRYLHFLYVAGVTESMQKHSTGIRNLQLKEYKNIELPLPSLAEQKRIVAILDEAFAGIDSAIANTEKNLANARELFESYLNIILTQKGEGWSQVTLSEVTGGIFTGPFGSLLHKSDYVENEIPLVNPAHITEVGIEADLRKTVSKETAQRLKSYIMHEGDIVIGRRGEMGRCAIVTEAEDGWLCGTGSFFIKSSSQCDSRYLVRLLRSEGCKRRLEKIAGGAVMPNLSNKDLSSFHVDLPPLVQQALLIQRIDELHEETHRLESIYQQKLDSLKELKQSLLQKAFSGELTAAKATTEAILKEEEIA